MHVQHHFSREVALLVGDENWRQQQVQSICQYYAVPAIYCAEQAPAELPEQAHFTAFQHSRNLLGQECCLAFFDATYHQQLAFHLESLAIIAATLKAGGKLFVLLPTWQDLEQTLDRDSLRWNSLDQYSCSAQFMRWFKQQVTQANLPIYHAPPPLTKIHAPFWQVPTQALQEQQQILQQLLAPTTNIYLLLAGRGRGKSALAGQFIRQMQDNVLVTAANRQAINSVLKFAGERQVHFIAPDELQRQLLQHQTLPYQWLIVDEAARLPLSLLQQFCQAFPHILLLSTSEGYEGTGQGFRLKLEQRLAGKLTRLTLTTPLRWQKYDVLEKWVNELALLQPIEMVAVAPNQQPLHFSAILQNVPLAQLSACYHLLSLAHYRTSPMDLRRLMDGHKQQFLFCHAANQLVGVVWGLQEGGIVEPEILTGIRLGYRRPKGSLVAQALSFQANHTAAAQLHSLRISRIAVLPLWQRQGIGTQLIQQLIQHYQTTTIDYLSVSFGYSPALYLFWQRCGFSLLGISSGMEASSGHYSVMMGYPLSSAGKRCCQQIAQKFLRNIVLSRHPLCAELITQGIPDTIDWQLNQDDWQDLSDFIEGQRTLAVTYPSLQRLFHSYPEPRLEQQLQQLMCLFVAQQKQKLRQFKQDLAIFLQEI